ncbi:hypothetical protein [Helicobacter marmotae]|uniref:hypothetical protein n=1 Tax=Helicobacter marmotae TaxID=152490 RepID=UPI0011C03D3D|nr:hypothetical protein [Helicobacter marmotae]
MVMLREILRFAQNDKVISLAGSKVCHSEHYEKKTPPELLATPLLCHSEGRQSLTEESLKESLVAKRDSSPAMQAQNDKLCYRLSCTNHPKG